MTANDSGARALHHAPFTREEFFSIRQTQDPDQAYAEVCRIIQRGERPSGTLSQCSEWIDGFGVESVSLATGSELLYVNKGGSYDSTLCHVEGEGYFVSSWGDVVESADRDHEEGTGERRCCYCSEWADPEEPCGSCGRDPTTGDPWPDPLRHVELETEHTLRTWDTGRTDRQGRSWIGYEFTGADGARIFAGEDFRCSPLHADDSDDSLRALLGFLTLRPGDTDADYFDGYTDAQREFCDSSDCETLGWLYSEEGPGEFTDIDGEVE